MTMYYIVTVNLLGSAQFLQFGDYHTAQEYYETAVSIGDIAYAQFGGVLTGMIEATAKDARSIMDGAQYEAERERGDIRDHRMFAIQPGEWRPRDMTNEEARAEGFVDPNAGAMNNSGLNATDEYQRKLWEKAQKDEQLQIDVYNGIRHAGETI